MVWASPQQLRGQVEENLRQLGRDHLDVVNLRLPRSAAGASVAGHFAALAAVRDTGLIRRLGVSGVDVAQLTEAQSIAPVVCVQNRYGIGAAPAEREVLKACGDRGIAYVPYFAIACDGRGAQASRPERADVLAVARAHGATAAQVRLAWTLQQGPHVLAIPGTGNLAHLEANVAAGALRLSPEEMARLSG